MSPAQGAQQECSKMLSLPLGVSSFGRSTLFSEKLFIGMAIRWHRPIKVPVFYTVALLMWRAGGSQRLDSRLKRQFNNAAAVLKPAIMPAQ